ncbi:hypothetical protein [Micromonospora taraxaci]|uniref:hypothetical protein n=1 Tax=Micromonospora taraxaci TaxID=1316803 RepID=UPI0033A80F36
MNRAAVHERRSGSVVQVRTAAAEQATTLRRIPFQREEPPDPTRGRVDGDHPLVAPGLIPLALEEQQLRRVPDVEEVIEEIVWAERNGGRTVSGRTEGDFSGGSAAPVPVGVAKRP